CANAPGRRGQTWITPEMAQTYMGLHRVGVGHSAEVWQGDRLVGGLFGVSLGGAFFAESMFSAEDNASKYALIKFCQWLSERDFHFVDCQMMTSHLRSMGAREIPRKDYLNDLNA